MANSLWLLLVGIIVLAAGMNAQYETSTDYTTPSSPSTDYYCPGDYVYGIYCRCYMQDPGFRIECDANYKSSTTPEEARDALVFYQGYGPVVNFYVYDITTTYFNYVPDNFLAGYQIPNVHFQCSHSHSVVGNLLLFSINAFTDGSGVCGLTGNVTFSDCNLRQFDTTTLKNCNQLEKLAFIDSHVETLINIPTLDSLTNFTVYSPRQWTGANQRGLSRMTLAPDASLPQLTYLDFTGNSLKDDSIEFVTQLTFIEELHLEGNNFGAVPNLTESFHLQTFSMMLNENATDVSVLLPNPKTQLKTLTVNLYSSNPKTVNNITTLEGMFVRDTINFQLNMTEFKESVFLDPLQTNRLTINLNPTSRIACGCNISWLIRDNPALLFQVNNGTCADGRPFQSVPAEEVSCCSNDSLLRQIQLLRKENQDLKAMQSNVRSFY